MSKRYLTWPRYAAATANKRLLGSGVVNRPHWTPSYHHRIVVEFTACRVNPCQFDFLCVGQARQNAG